MYCMGVARNRAKRTRRTKAMEPDESPQTVHRVALHVGAMIECQKWIQHSLQLKRQGKLQLPTEREGTANGPMTDPRGLSEWLIGVCTVRTSNPTPHIDFRAKSDGEQRKTNDARGNGAAYRDTADHDHQVASDDHCQRRGMLQHDYDLQRGSLLAIADAYKSGAIRPRPVRQVGDPIAPKPPFSWCHARAIIQARKPRARLQEDCLRL